MRTNSQRRDDAKITVRSLETPAATRLVRLRGLLIMTALIAVSGAAHADVVTGTVSPANAKVIVVDKNGATVAELKPGAYQLQLPAGKYKAQCQAPNKREQEFLSLSEPVTVDIDCG
jgi:hypothetical protein